MASFVRSLSLLLLVAVLGLAGAPAHTGTADHLTHADQALHDHCATQQGHAAMAECLQGAHCLALSMCAVGLAQAAAQIGSWPAWRDESATPAPSEAATPPPRSA